MSLRQIAIVGADLAGLVSARAYREHDRQPTAAGESQP
jgi:predicted NAD/FAD-dependent oxidoreductase